MRSAINSSNASGHVNVYTVYTHVYIMCVAIKELWLNMCLYCQSIDRHYTVHGLVLPSDGTATCKTEGGEQLTIITTHFTKIGSPDKFIHNVYNACTQEPYKGENLDYCYVYSGSYT